MLRVTKFSYLLKEFKINFSFFRFIMCSNIAIVASTLASSVAAYKNPNAYQVKLVNETNNNDKIPKDNTVVDTFPFCIITMIKVLIKICLKIFFSSFVKNSGWQRIKATPHLIHTHTQKTQNRVKKKRRQNLLFYVENEMKNFILYWLGLCGSDVLNNCHFSQEHQISNVLRSKLMMVRLCLCTIWLQCRLLAVLLGTQ
jgi:short subunit fatty acids transporter